MANFWDSPLKQFEGNKVVLTDYVRKVHYQEMIRERFKYSASERLYDDYMQMETEIYVFSEKELRSLVDKMKNT